MGDQQGGLTAGPSLAPRVFMTIGPAGSGKSAVARAIARQQSAVYLDKDRVAAPFVELAMELLGQDPNERESNDVYLQRVMPVEYRTLFDVASDNLNLGRSVVLDAPFAAYLDDPDFVAANAEHSGWPDVGITVVHVNTSEAVVRERLKARGNARDRWKLENWSAFWNRLGRVECAWRGVTHVDVANDGGPDLTFLHAR